MQWRNHQPIHFLSGGTRQCDDHHGTGHDDLRVLLARIQEHGQSAEGQCAEHEHDGQLGRDEAAREPAGEVQG